MSKELREIEAWRSMVVSGRMSALSLKDSWSTKVLTNYLQAYPILPEECDIDVEIHELNRLFSKHGLAFNNYHYLVSFHTRLKLLIKIRDEKTKEQKSI